MTKKALREGVKYGADCVYLKDSNLFLATKVSLLKMLREKRILDERL